VTAVRTVEHRWYDEDEYYRLYTLYQLGTFLARVNIIEAELGFLPGGDGRRAHRFNDDLYGPFNGLTSFRPFGDDYTLEELDRSQVPRGMLKAVGEAMTSTIDASKPIGFTEFVERYGGHDFSRWFKDLDDLLLGQGPDEGSRWDRLIVTAAEFRILARRLDPKGNMVQLLEPANLDRLNSPAARGFVQARWTAAGRP